MTQPNKPDPTGSGTGTGTGSNPGHESVLQTLREAGIAVYDNSSLSSLITCPRMFYYRHELGLVSLHDEQSPALRFGLAVHLALETWLRYDKDDDLALNTFVNSFTPHEERPSIGKTGRELQATYTVLYGCSILTEYFHTYRSDSRQVVQLETPLAEEVSDGVFIAGRIDKLMMSSRGYVFADYKTTKYMNDFIITPNPQFMAYKHICERLTGQPVSGELDIIGVAKNKPPRELLRREPFDYSPHQMSEWRKSVAAWVNLVNQYRQAEFWPQTWRCRPFFRDCMYKPLCTLPAPDAHDSIIQTMYRVERWDPFKEAD